MYLEGVTPWKSAAWVPPPAEHMARIRREAGADLETAAAAAAPGPRDGGAGGARTRGRRLATRRRITRRRCSIMFFLQCCI